MLDKQSTSSLLRSQQRMKERSPSQEFSCLVSLFQVFAGEVDSPLIQVDSLLSVCQSRRVYRLLGSCFFRGSCLVRQSDFDRKMREEWNERVNEERERYHHHKQFLSLFPVTYDDDGCLLSFWQLREKRGSEKKKRRVNLSVVLWTWSVIIIIWSRKRKLAKTITSASSSWNTIFYSLSLPQRLVQRAWFYNQYRQTWNDEEGTEGKKIENWRKKKKARKRSKKEMKFSRLFEKSISADVSSYSPFSWLFLDVSLIHFSLDSIIILWRQLLTWLWFALNCLFLSSGATHFMHHRLLLFQDEEEEEEENARENLWDFSLNPQREEDQILLSYRSIRGITFLSSHSMHIQR